MSRSELRRRCGQLLRAALKHVGKARGSYIAIGLAVALLLAIAPAEAAFTELIVFGDSLSDAGNDKLVFGVPLPPYFNGRFSNGPLWVDQFATGLGIPVATASLAGGRNYAYGGAESGEGSSFVSPFIPNLGPQIDAYIASGAMPTSSQLFVVFAGHNNFRGGETDPSVPVADMAAHITELAGLGASNFLVSTLMPLGKLPESEGGPNEAALDALTLQFNTLLLAQLPTLRTTLGVNIFEFDTWGVMQDMLANPGAYGFTNVTEPAYVGPLTGTGTVVPNPSQYLFWDDVHPATIAQSYIAAAALAAVPEPSSWLLAACGGLAVLAIAGRCSRRAAQLQEDR
jgi:phospholipase/lecithinase/hemolysin